MTKRRDEIEEAENIIEDTPPPNLGSIQEVSQPAYFKWSQFLTDLPLTASEIEEALWQADVTEIHHIFSKPNEVNGAFLTVLRLAMGDLRQKIKEYIQHG